MHYITQGLRRVAFQPATATPVVTDNQTLIKEYLDWKASYTTSAVTSYGTWVRRFQNFTNKAPEALAIGDWTAFALSLRGRYAPKCVEFALNIVHNYLRYWHEQGRLRLPLYLVRVPKAIAQSHLAITEEEYRQMVAVLKKSGNLRNLALIMLLHDSGVRVGEVVGLEIDQMEEDASAVIRTEKTVARRRIFWNWDTNEVLRQYLVRRITRDHPSDWLFIRHDEPTDKPLTTRSVQRIVAEVCKEAGIVRKLSPHSFRHAFIHRLAALGVPDAILAQLVGHSSPESIAHYTKLSRPEAEDFARRQFDRIASHSHAGKPQKKKSLRPVFDSLALAA